MSEKEPEKQPFACPKCANMYGHRWSMLAHLWLARPDVLDGDDGDGHVGSFTCPAPECASALLART